MAKNTVAIPAAKIWGTAEIEHKVDIVVKGDLTTKKTKEVTQEVLAYMDENTRKAVFSGAAAVMSSLTAACMSLIHDVVSAHPHSVGIASDAKAWKQLFADAEQTTFGNGVKPQIWMTCKSTVKRWLTNDPEAMTGDHVICTADGSLNSLRILKSWVPKVERVSQTIAEKVAEMCDKDEEITPVDVVTEMFEKKILGARAMFEVVLAELGEDRVRALLANRIKERRAERQHLAIAA